MRHVRGTTTSAGVRPTRCKLRRFGAADKRAGLGRISGDGRLISTVIIQRSCVILDGRYSALYANRGIERCEYDWRYVDSWALYMV